MFVLDAVGDDEQHFLRRIAVLVGAVAGVGNVARLAELASELS